MIDGKMSEGDSWLYAVKVNSESYRGLAQEREAVLLNLSVIMTKSALDNSGN